MFAYILNIVLLIVWGLLLLKFKKIPGRKVIFVAVATIQWILLSGLRHISIGADTYVYSRSFLNIKYESWSQLFHNFYSILFLGAEGKDPGYAIFEKIVSTFTMNYQMYLIIIAILFTVSLGIWIYNNSRDIFISFLIYSCLFYTFFAITGHRQTIATALVALIGYKYVKERNFLPFLILILIAATIHKSALIFLVYYFIANKKITMKYIILVFTSIPVVFIFKDYLYYFLTLTGLYDSYGKYEGAGAWNFTFMLLLITVVAVWRSKIILNNNIQATHFYNALFLALIFVPLTFVNPSAMRVVQYFSIYIMLLIPEIINSFKGKERVAVYYVAVSVVILFFIKDNPQYLFFWQDIKGAIGRQ